MRWFWVLGLLVCLPALAQQRWVKKQNINTGRESAAGFALDGNAYIGTGFTGTNRLRDLWSYDLANNGWTQRANFTATRSATTAFAIGDKGYFVAGWNGTTRFNDTWQYDPQTNTWTQKTDFPGTARTLAVAFVISGKAYVGLGGGFSSARYGDFWRYDPVGNSWLQVADFGGNARSAAVAFSIGQKGYAGSGIGLSGDILKDFWSYDPNTDTWTKIADLPGSFRRDAVGFAYRGKGYVGLGANLSTRLSDLWSYDPGSDTWIQVGVLPFGGRESAIAQVVGDDIFIGMGNNGSSRFGDWWHFATDCPAFTIANDTLATATQNASYSDDLLALGGYDEGKWRLVGGQLPQGMVLDSIQGRIRGKTSQMGDFPLTLEFVGKRGFLAKDMSVTTSSPNSPTGEGPENIIDGNPSSKYLNFDKLNVWVTINTQGRYRANGISITTANDARERDPKSAIISGSNDGINFEVIDSVIFGCTSERFSVLRASFRNSSFYQFYRIQFSNVCDVSFANSMQVAEMQLLDWDCRVSKDFTLKVAPGGSWTRRLDMSSILQSAVSFVIGDNAYVGTGQQGTPKKEFWRYNGTVWTQAAALPGAERYNAVGFAVGGRGYVGLGTNTGTQFLRDFWEYNPATNSWQRRADYGGSARYESIAFVAENKAYVGLGFDGRLRNDIWQYDPSANSWTQKLDFPGVERDEAAAWALGSTGYVVTGINGTTRFADGWAYDTRNDSWSKMPEFPGVARSGAVAFTIGQKGYLALGTDSLGTWLTDLWEFDPASQRWTAGADFSGEPRIEPVAFALGTKGYVATGSSQKDLWSYDPQCPSGQIDPEQIPDLILNAPVYIPLIQQGLGDGVVWSLLGNLPAGLNLNSTTGEISGIPTQSGIYEFLVQAEKDGCQLTARYQVGVEPIGSWTQTTSLPGLGRESAASFSIGDKGYIVAGQNGTSPRRDVWEFDPKTETWTQKSNAGFTARYGTVAFVIAGQAYVGLGGGRNATTSFSDFWKYDASGNTWTRLNNFPSERAGAVAFVIGNKGYVGSGFNYFEHFSDFWSYDPSTDTWQPISGLVTPRSNAVSFSIDGMGYVGLGTSQSGSALYDLWQYNPQLGTWSPQTDFPEAFSDKPYGFALGKKGYVNTVQNKFFQYDPVVQTWQRKPDLPGLGRSGAFAFTIGDTAAWVGSGLGGFGGYGTDVWRFNPSNECSTQFMPNQLPNGILGSFYAFGGFSLTQTSFISPQWSAQGLPDGLTLNSSNGSISGIPTRIGSFDVSITISDANCSKTKTFPIVIREAPLGAWVQRKSMPIPRRFGVGFAVRERGYVGLGDNGQPLKDFWSYDPQSRTWTQIAELPGQPRTSAVAFVIADAAFVGSGRNGEQLLSDFWRYDPQGNRWTQAKGLDVGRYDAVAFQLKGRGYVGLGATSQGQTKDFWQYNPQTDSWQSVKEFGGNAREGATAFTISDRAYVGLGENRSAFFKDFWTYDPDADTWKAVKEFPSQPRKWAVGYGMSQFGLVGTGFDGSLFKDFWEYDPYNDSWVQVVDFSGSPRSGAVGFQILDKVYLASGNDGSRQADVWEYSPENCPPIVIPLKVLPSIVAGQQLEVELQVQGIPQGLAEWSVSHAIQNSLITINDGILSIAVTQAGSYPITITAKRGRCSASRQFVLNVEQGNAVFNTAILLLGLKDAVSFALSDTAIIIATGEDVFGGLVSSCWQYNPRTQKIDGLPDFGGDLRTGAVAYVVGDSAYVGLGRNESDELLNDIWVYREGLWAKRADFPGRPRQGAVAFTIGKTAYIAAGDNGITRFKDVWAFDPAIGIWQRKNDLPEDPGLNPVAWGTSDKGYLLSGNGYFPTKTNFWAYDPATDSWEKKTPPIDGQFNLGDRISRSEAVGFVIDNKPFLSGGNFELNNNDNAYSIAVLGDFQSYDPKKDQWKILPPNPVSLFETSRSNATATAVGSSAYIFGGQFYDIMFQEIIKFSPLCPVASVSPSVLPPLVAGQPYRAELTVEGLDGFVFWEFSPQLPLPEGLYIEFMDPFSGILTISGIPTQSGPFTALVVATNGACSAQGLFLPPNATIWDGLRWSNGSPDATKVAIISGYYNTGVHGGFSAALLANLSEIYIDAGDKITILTDVNNDGGKICGSGILEVGNSIIGNPFNPTVQPAAPSSVSIIGLERRDSTATLDIEWTASSSLTRRLVVLKKGSPVADKAVLDGRIYAADPNWLGVGDELDGGKVVYAGTGDLVQVRGLNGSFDEYFASVYEYEDDPNCGTVYSSGTTANVIAALPDEPSAALVYPNPARQSLHILIQGRAQARLYTPTGTQVITRQFENKATWDVSELPRGIYLLEIINETGKSTRKIVLE